MSSQGRAVTGLILHFRTPGQTLACLASLSENGISRAIIVDNSEDAGQSIRAMRSGLAKLREGGLDAIVVSQGRNLGFAGGVSFGLQATAKHVPGHVLLINSDARLEPGALVAMRSKLPLAEIVVPWLRRGDGEEPRSLVSYYQKPFGLILRRPWVATARHASGCCLLLRQDMALPGLFDEDFFFYGEDTMLGFRMDREGRPVLECRGAVVRHAGSGSARNGSLFYEYHMNRAHWLLASKMARSPLERCVYQFFRCFTLPLRATVRCLRVRSLVPWRALLAATQDVARGRCQPLTPPAGGGQTLDV